MGFETDQELDTLGTREIRHALEPLDAITLAEMDDAALMNRVDTKFVFGESCLIELLERIQPEYRVLGIDGHRDFRYETLYFDTSERQCYLQHHNGKLNRQKYRIRQYQRSGRCFLEVKKKNSKGRTDKRRMAISAVDEILLPHHKAFIREATGSLPDLRPEIWTCFSRATLVNRSRPERVTIDRELSFRDHRTHVTISGLVIAEVKQERDDRSTPVREFLRGLPVRPTRVSKFCLGSMLLTPGLKYNRFKETWLAIKKAV